MTATDTRRIRADQAQIEHYLDELYGTAEHGYLAVWTLETERTAWYSVTDRSRAANAIAVIANTGRNAYVGVGLHPVNRGAYQRGNADGVCALPGLFADVDFVTDQPAHKAENLPTEDQALAVISAMPLPPTMIVRSGFGFYPLWLFHEIELIEGDADEQTAKRTLLKATNKGWQALLKSKLRAVTDNDVTLDPTADLARILRPVGTINHKPDCAPVRVGIVHEGGPRYTLGDFEEFLPDITTEQRETTHIDKTEAERGQIQKVLEGCPWLQHTYDDAAKLPEPEWFAGMSIVANCHNGLFHAHTYSSPYPGYSFDETQRKATVARREDKPVRCASVAADYSGERFCKACPNRGKITSPIELGTRVEFRMPTVNGNGRHHSTESPGDETSGGDSGITLADFGSYLPDREYIYLPTGKMWEPEGINRAFPPIGKIKQSTVIDAGCPIHDLTWAPGKPQIISNAFLDQGGWITKQGARVYNHYRSPPVTKHSDPYKADRWLDLLERVYPDDAKHIVRWFAHRVQRPGEKLNHALVLGGMQGIGKDSILEPVRDAVGPQNFGDVSPEMLTGRFNAFLKNVILRVSELRDIGDRDRYGFYEHTKTLIAAPPETVLIDEKNIRAYRVPNLVGVVFTTNHRTDGLYLPEDDRRHYVAWSDARPSDFAPEFWAEFYAWLDAGGRGNVAAYLAAVDLDTFDPKAPPPKTSAFWDIVSASRAPEDAPLTDAIEVLGNPDALTVADVVKSVKHDTDSN